MAARASMTESRYVHALALGLDPAWRRQTRDERCRSAEEFCAALSARSEVTTFTYSMIGLKAGVDMMLWSLAPSVEALEEKIAAALRTGMGTWMAPRQSFLGIIRPSQYVKRPTPQEQSLFSGERSKYLVVYPFTKSADWYLLSQEERQTVMNEHMKIGHRYQQVRQLLAYSFGVDDMDFLVAYETDDLAAFGDLVRELRGTESRRSTVRDTPIMTGIHRPIEAITRLLGAE
ncbi:MAG: chlorite dismutase family protein [Chloroflexi bacterium]|nr:MAG: chlorite dismutase family protein [Chloroflexota bacterium]TMF19613.1 MAG: chlorite dismutase family protein [Chloroflexota bacterium]